MSLGQSGSESTPRGVVIEGEPRDNLLPLSRLLFKASRQIGSSIDGTPKYLGQVLPESTLKLDWNRGFWNMVLDDHLIFYKDDQPIKKADVLAQTLRAEGPDFDVAAFALRALWQIDMQGQKYKIAGETFQGVAKILQGDEKDFVTRVVINPQTGEKEVYVLYVDPNGLKQVDHSRVIRIIRDKEGIRREVPRTEETLSDDEFLQFASMFSFQEQIGSQSYARTIVLSKEDGRIITGIHGPHGFQEISISLPEREEIGENPLTTIAREAIRLYFSDQFRGDGVARADLFAVERNLWSVDPSIRDAMEHRMGLIYPDELPEKKQLFGAANGILSTKNPSVVEAFFAAMRVSEDLRTLEGLERTFGETRDMRRFDDGTTIFFEIPCNLMEGLSLYLRYKPGEDEDSGYQISIKLTKSLAQKIVNAAPFTPNTVVH